MDSFRVSDDMPLEAKMVTDAIDKVQLLENRALRFRFGRRCDVRNAEKVKKDLDVVGALRSALAVRFPVNDVGERARLRKLGWRWRCWMRA